MADARRYAPRSTRKYDMKTSMAARSTPARETFIKVLFGLLFSVLLFVAASGIVYLICLPLIGIAKRGKPVKALVYAHETIRYAETDDGAQFRLRHWLRYDGHRGRIDLDHKLPIGASIDIVYDVAQPSILTQGSDRMTALLFSWRTWILVAFVTATALLVSSSAWSWLREKLKGSGDNRLL